EDAVRLREDEVAADQHALALVAFRKEGEEHLHLFAVLLDVPDVIDENNVEGIEAVEFLLQFQRFLRDEEPLDESERREKEHLEAPLDELVADGAEDVGLPTTRQAEGQDILAT